VLAATSHGEEIRPLIWGETKGLYQRVITLPGAQLLASPASAARRVQPELPVFDVFYVFGRDENDDQGWVEVGRQWNDVPEGWIDADLVQDWSLMLVMQYEAPGQREPVLFFEDMERLRDLVLAVDVDDRARALIRAVEAGKHEGKGLIAIEDTSSGHVSFEGNPYLMPILNSAWEEFDDGTPTTLVKVASLNSEYRQPRESDQEDLVAKARRGIVFVIDTTISMEPYIERAREVARRIYEELGRNGLLERTSFGLVGYRNNMDYEPQRSRLEYVSRVEVALDPETPSERLLEGLKRMSPAPVSTHTWDEDAVAGLYDAVWGMDWEPFDELRLVILITDAGALEGDDPKSKHYEDQLSLWSVKQKAIQKDIVLLPIHLWTPEAKRAGNIEHARQQYRELGYTGDINVNKYMFIEAGAVEGFGQQLDLLARDLEGVTERASAGIAEEKPDMEKFSGGFTLGSLFRNEVYSAQQRFLGEIKGAQATGFYRAFAADRDLTQPQYRALKVSVFLTRNQFNALAQSLSRLVERARLARESPETFFGRLQELAYSFSVDPERSFTTIADAGLLPEYLELLPYRSRVLRMTEDEWLRMGPGKQIQFVSDLHDKLRIYEEINADRRKWKDLGAGDPGLQVYPVALELLP
jgi:serine/threonine-protein kinase PpkA